jgi:hypothetical protein
MTDEELVKRLRIGVLGYQEAAADRIEQLGKACAEWAEVSQSNYQRAKAAEAKLAKASETLRLALKYNTAMHRGASEFNKRILATLAEIEGEKT